MQVAPDVDVESLTLLLCQVVDIHPSRRNVMGLYAVTKKSSPLAPKQLVPDKDFFLGDLFQVRCLALCPLCVTGAGSSVD